MDFEKNVKRMIKLAEDAKEVAPDSIAKLDAENLIETLNHMLESHCGGEANNRRAERKKRKAAKLAELTKELETFE